MRESSKGTSQVQTKSLTWVWILLSVIVVITLITLLTVFYYGETAQDMAESGSSQAEQVSAGTVGSPLDGSGNKISLSSLSCDTLDSVFRDTLDCCGAGQGTKRCEGVNNAHEKACGNALSCLNVGGRIVAAASEFFLGQDVNNDGDQSDETFVVKNLDSGETTYEPVSYYPPLSMDGDILAYRQDETTDNVIMRDLSTGTTQTASSGNAFLSPDSVEGSLVAFRTRIDHDNDGHSENVVRVYDMASDQILYTAPDATHPALAQDFVAYSLSENTVGVDLNGDGQIHGTVIHYYDFNSQTEHHIGMEGRDVRADGDRIVFTQATFDEGSPRQKLYVYDIANETVEYAQIQHGHVNSPPSLDGDYVASQVYESIEGIDFNDDGDTTDASFVVLDLTTQTISKPGKIIEGGGANDSPRLDNGTVLYRAEGGGLALYDIATEQSQRFNDIDAFNSRHMAFDIIR